MKVWTNIMQSLLLAALFASSLVAPVPVAAADFKAHSVLTSDGVRLSVREWGVPGQPTMVFVHGGGQSQLVWKKQVESGLAGKFRIVTYDLRGHGESDKPTDPAAYSSSARWSDDLHAVIASLQLDRPILVAWSAGSRVAMQYAMVKGTNGLGGLVFVDASNGRFFAESILRLLPAMTSNTLETNIAGTAGFIRSSFSGVPSAEDFEYLLGFNMVVPPYARKGMGSWPLNIEQALGTVAAPTLFIHGGNDRIVKPEAATYHAGLVKGSTVSIYEKSGHMPFWEEAERFNAELARFVESHWKGTAR